MPSSLELQRTNGSPSRNKNNAGSCLPSKQPQSKHLMEKHMNKACCLGAVEVTIGVILAVVYVITVQSIKEEVDELAKNGTGFKNMSFLNIFHGVWCGIFLILSGIIGIRIGSKPTRFMYIANLLMAIIVSLATCASVTVSTIATIYGPRSRLINAFNEITAVISFMGLIIAVSRLLLCCGVTCSDEKMKKRSHLRDHQNAAFVSYPGFVYQPSAPLNVASNQTELKKRSPNKKQREPQYQNIQQVNTGYPASVFQFQDGHALFNGEVVTNSMHQSQNQTSNVVDTSHSASNKQVSSEIAEINRTENLNKGLTQAKQMEIQSENPYSFAGPSPTIALMDQRFIYPDRSSPVTQSIENPSNNDAHFPTVNIALSSDGVANRFQQQATAPGYTTLNIQPSIR